jgi:DNA-binding HxlR family transcriptional regulator
VLAETLHGMESDGLVVRRVLTDTAPRHAEYALTALGATLREPLVAICARASVHSYPRAAVRPSPSRIGP